MARGDLNIPKFFEVYTNTFKRLTAAAIVNEAKRNVRHDTRALQNSIFQEILPGGDIEVSAGGPGIDYAAVQEYGPRDQPSQAKPPEEPKNGRGGPYTFNPYMRPAAAYATSDSVAQGFVADAESVAETRARLGI